MSAYIIFIRNSITDPEEMKIYGGKAAKVPPNPKMKALALYGAAEALEGQACEGVVMIEFPTMDEARAWYNSPEYQDALQHRLKGADYRVILTAGL